MSEYKASITATKGGKQLINVLSSTAISSLLVVVVSNLMGKEVKAETIQEGINHISGAVIFITPIVSSFVRMISNYIKNRKRRI